MILVRPALIGTLPEEFLALFAFPQQDKLALIGRQHPPPLQDAEKVIAVQKIHQVTHAING
jgi:hypothetical protein